jgi:ribosomal protein S26
MVIRDVECGQCHTCFPTVQVPRDGELRLMYCLECGCQALQPNIRARVERKTEAKA